MTLPNAEQVEEAKESPQYYISFERIAQLNRSAVAILAARRGPSCPSLVQQTHELTDPQKLLEEIAEYCSDEPGYIRPDMPLQEMVFRILLTRRNESTSLHDLHYELTEKWATPIRPISTTEEGLGRILDSDTYYGFAQKTPAT